MRAGKQLCCRLAFVLTLAFACAGTSALAVGAPGESRGAVERFQLRGAGGAVMGDYVPGEAVVHYERGVSAAERREARSDADVEFEDALRLPRTETVDVDGSVAAAVLRLERQPGVAYAQPNYRYEALAVEPPKDPFFESGALWGLDDPALLDPGVGVLEAWEEREGVAQVRGAGQVIAVLDTGVDLTHPDLAANLWTNPAPDPITEDLHGYDFIDEDGDPDDFQFHGTHVAGTAAAIAGNEKGIAGVAPGAEIMAVRVLDGDGFGSSGTIVDGILYAAGNGADVINMSLGGSAGDDQATEEAIEFAGEENSVVVAAAGNDGVDNDVQSHVPCSLPQPNLICVAALNRNGGLASFSNYGNDSVDIAAPGGGDVPFGGILSAKADYKVVFTEDFEDGIVGWEASAEGASIPWGPSSVKSQGAGSASDSPGSGVNYAPNSDTQLFTESPVSLTGERGCRLHFDLRRDIQPKAGGEFTDFVFAGALTSVSGIDQVQKFAGSSGGNFEAEEFSISALDGRPDVFPAFGLFSDATDQRDGAYVDDVQLLCRDGTYDLPEADDYLRLNGTSMATPHVSGVVALVQAAAPGLSAVEVVEAVLAGASAIPKPSATRHIATEGIADACQAIAVATAADFKVECPGSSENVPFQPPVENPPPAPGPAPQPPPPPPPVDRDPPSTFFKQRPPKLIRTATNRARAVFQFGSDEDGATFVCSIDNKPYRPCGRRIVRRLGVGGHVLRVVARDLAGNVDRSPAVYRFKVKRSR